ncbi:VOC family protein [Microlunatus lacustris]
MSRTDVPPGRLRYKDLCVDAVDAARMCRFWASALGLTAEMRGDNAILADDVPEHTLWVNQVPEPVTAKQRVHLDLHVAAVDDLVRLGAEVVDDTLPWTLMKDPEGGELCAFLRDPDRLPRYRLYELCVDSGDAERIARWWAARFGVGVEHSTEGDFCWLERVPGMPWPMVFGNVPEPKTVKNRVHWDVWGDTQDAVAAGATLLRAEDDDIRWDVLADPDGNEFCVFDVE